jgi:hypothetical protein
MDGRETVEFTILPSLFWPQKLVMNKLYMYAIWFG